MRPFLPVASFALLGLVMSSPARAGEPPPAPTPVPAAPAPAGPAAPAPAVATPVVSVPTYDNTTCPIMGKPSSKALFADTEFGRIYVCCPPCIRKIQADAARAYQTAFPVVKKVGNTIDPVTGEKIGDKPVLLSMQGYELALASEASLAPARANGLIVLTKALRPQVVDVGNHTDPLTGRPVVDNVFVLIDDDLVHLSGPEVVAQVRLDPEKARKAAKALATAEAAARAKVAPAPTQPK